MLQAIIAQRNWRPSGMSLWLSDTGTNAGQWDDLSGNNRHATQGTAGLQPAIVTNVINGRQVRRFDGTVSGDIMRTAYTPPASYTLLVVATRAAQNTSTLSNNRSIVSAGSSENAGSVITTSRDDVVPSPYLIVVNYRPSNAASSLANSFPNATPSVITALFGTTVSIQIGTFAAVTNTGSTSTNGVVTIGGDQYNTARRFAGDIAEVILYASVLSAVEITRNQQYLAIKYNLPIA